MESNQYLIFHDETGNPTPGYDASGLGRTRGLAQGNTSDS